MIEPIPYKLAVQADEWLSVEPRPNPEALKRFYAQVYYQQSHGAYAATYSDMELAHRRLLSDLLLTALTDAGGAPAGRRLLEIGCGEGWFLKAALEAGYDARGLEFADHGLKQFNPQLIDRVEFGDSVEALEHRIELGRAVDVFVMEHVLEHVIDPEALLSRLPRMLSPQGVVAITVPNDFSPIQLKAQAMGHIDGPFWVNPPQHLHYFNYKTLPRLLERTGFEVVGGFASFPIDWFLFHPGSNYVRDPTAGKATHQARVALDLTIAQQGMAAYHALAKALLACGVGRSITLVGRRRPLIELI